MKKSPVAGIAGSIRIECLNKLDLIAAEKHGKRLDTTSEARAITNAPPITSTGLNLCALYEAHVSDALVHKCTTIAKQVVIQFPKDLIDGEDAAFMLHHSRSIVEGIFGDQAIFADRIDRDERGRHNVDIFIAPKAIKTTKKTSKLAVTVTKHEEALAEKHGRRNSTYGRGQAAQDELFRYFRDVMCLEGVQRGNPKVVAGPDWKSAEELRDAELTEKERIAEERSHDLEERATRISDQQHNVYRAEIAADEVRAETERLRAEATQDAAAAAAAREDAEAAERRAELKSQEAASLLESLQRQEMEGAARRNEERRRADEDRHAASLARKDAEDLRAVAKANLASVMAEKGTLDDERSAHLAQVALLARACNDQSELNLRTSEKTFAMNWERMTPKEYSAFRSPWSAGLSQIGRILAVALEGVRALKDRLLVREAELDRQKRDTDARDAHVQREREQHSRDVEGHMVALRLLDRQRAEVAEKEECAKDALVAAGQKADKAAEAEVAARSTLMSHQNWVSVIKTLGEHPEGTKTVGDRIQADPSILVKLPPTMAAFLKWPAPEWARMVVADRFASAQERQKARSAAVALETMLGEARTVLSPVQQKTVAQAKQVMRQHGFGDPGVGL